MSLLVFSLTGYAWAQYHSLNSGVHKSGALNGEATSLNGDTNILIMGLDSRLDEDGNALPPKIYDALHAGSADDGGENANVLMLLHVPANGGKATSISIPRDDYVSIPGCPDEQCKGKIKQAYGLAFDAESKKLVSQNKLSRTQKVQQERDAGRKEEVDAVRQLLGGVPVDHYVEVTLVAFLQIAQVVQPITVCLNEATQDTYSGANFHKGQQQISAEQAVEFVRQRRDYVHPQLNFTDLDRERRQQAFISSLSYQLKQAGTMADPTKLQGLLNVAKQNLAVDNGLDLLTFAGQASSLTGGNVTFVTLPIDHFGKDQSGEDVNMINVATIQALVHQLIGGGAPPPAASAAAPAGSASASPPSGVVDVINANGQAGLASELERALVGKGYTEGTTKNDSKHLSRSVIYYGSGKSEAAAGLSTLLGGVSPESDSAVPSGHLRVVLGTDFTMPSSLTGSTTGGAGSTPAASPAGPAPSNAATPGGADPSSDSMSVVSGGGIPCVK